MTPSARPTHPLMTVSQLEKSQCHVLEQLVGILEELSYRVRELEGENADLREETQVLRAEVSHLARRPPTYHEY